MKYLAVGFISLAAKMEETDVPTCLELQVGESKYIFEAKTIQRMKLLVLNTLKWRMQAITPFSFIDYFLQKINDEASIGASILQSSELILSTVRDPQRLQQEWQYLWWGTTCGPKNEREKGEEKEEGEDECQEIAATREAVLGIIVGVKETLFLDGVEVVLPWPPWALAVGGATLVGARKAGIGRLTGRALDAVYGPTGRAGW
ncbi:Cyclin-D4-1 G1/S-specific cyclin-D4-1 [Vigna angularis]|nr:Cyclin-D4-1 G1/S-specific cyclin-D4-1 [Vigna angularis]